MKRQRVAFVVLDVAAWERVGPELAEVDPDAFRRLLIAARSIVEMSRTEHPEAVAEMARPMLESTDGYLS